MPTPDYTKIATALVGAPPLSFKLYPDGSLVVIAPTGQKHKFTPQQVQSAIPELSSFKEHQRNAKSQEALAKPAPKPKSPGRPRSTPKSPTKPVQSTKNI